MFNRILPKEIGFFTFFEEHSRLSIEAAKELQSIAQNPSDLYNGIERIREVEHQADIITHKCIEALHRTFITPIDRGEIHRLMKRLDDIIDAIDSATSRMILYEIIEIRPEFSRFADILVTATTAINGALSSLSDLKKGNKAISDCCRVIHETEKKGDEILRSALARLFKEEKDPILVIKWKGIFERLERASDSCERVADIIEGIVIEAS
jgi:predicted phosphate transport protein (TIGR00153 family)